ncbi:MAG: response regulator [Candidatus Hydrogenedentota bacterium]|uniref:Putative two-component system response regulator n=1 Tax=Sumerlaea chitinivorans TaxID=2250252 RepID=A0A2Z4Y7P0_SUMC1|nr:putative two-component system response regulator [Candidatus Sumerlaea chitinivorans]MCX7962897.1 response regulator [Candidatus Sumerlaea chitinivorans]RMH24622.1 MAG: response regulator [Candidatus Hydrogenedentota bacterium]
MQAPANDNTRLRVLVVDDDPDIALVVRTTLASEYDVVVAPSGVAALERIHEYEPDVIVMDVMMPVLDGFDTSRAIRKDARYANVPILFLTARTDNDAVREAMLAGGDFFLPKPFETSQLLSRVRELVEKHRVQPQPKRFSLQELTATGSSLAPQMRSEQSPEAVTPMAEPNVTKTAPSRSLMEQLRGTAAPRRVRVLAVDDDLDTVNYVKSILRDDYEIITATDPELAIEKIFAYQPDILLLDIMMPKLTGFQVAQLIRTNRRLRAVRIVYVSSRSDFQAIQKAFNLGACEYIEKPFTPEQLRRKLLEITKQPDFVCSKKRLDYAEVLRRESDF